MDNGDVFVGVYRAKDRNNPRQHSTMIIGEPRMASKVLEEARILHKSFESDLFKPNSGLSIRLISTLT